MTANEYVQLVLDCKEMAMPSEIDEAAVYEVAQLLSGSFVPALCDSLWLNGFELDVLQEHLESLYDTGNHFGLIYFVFILANAIHFTIPAQFVRMSGSEELASALSAAIIEDWLGCGVVSG